MESYIVRIYRREQDDPKLLAGQVEDVSDGSIHPFTSLDALSEIFIRCEGSIISNEDRSVVTAEVNAIAI